MSDSQAQAETPDPIADAKRCARSIDMLDPAIDRERQATEQCAKERDDARAENERLRNQVNSLLVTSQEQDNAVQAANDEADRLQCVVDDLMGILRDYPIGQDDGTWIARRDAALRDWKEPE